MTSQKNTDSIKYVPLASNSDVRVGLVGHAFGGGGKIKLPSRKLLAIQKLAEDEFMTSHEGITFEDVIRNKLAKHKPQAQVMLKRCRRAGILFTFQGRKPQQYYSSNIESEVRKFLLSAKVPIEPSGVTSELKESAQDVRLQSLLDYVLPLLPDAPLFLHNPHLMFQVKPEYYDDLNISPEKRNRGKRQEYQMYNGMLSCTLYPNGTVDMYVRCNNKPFRLESYLDIGRLLVFLGQVKAFVMDFLDDPRERAVPDVMDWILTECDINKDIVVSHAFQVAALKVQGKIRVRDFECTLGIYFKSMGPDTVCRVETRGVSVGKRIGLILTGLYGLHDYVPEN